MKNNFGDTEMEQKFSDKKSSEKMVIKHWPNFFAMTKYFGDIANVAKSKMVLGQMNIEIMAVTE